MSKISDTHCLLYYLLSSGINPGVTKVCVPAQLTPLFTVEAMRTKPTLPYRYNLSNIQYKHEN